MREREKRERERENLLLLLSVPLENPVVTCLYFPDTIDVMEYISYGFITTEWIFKKFPNQNFHSFLFAFLWVTN